MTWGTLHLALLVTPGLTRDPASRFQTQEIRVLCQAQAERFGR